MRFAVELSGEVVERDELLDGTASVTLEGAGDGWTLLALLTWNIGPEQGTAEGDLTLTRADGAELFATLASADVVEQAEDPAALRFSADYDIDGGSGEFAGARGRASATGELQAATFHGRWRFDLAEGPPALQS